MSELDDRGDLGAAAGRPRRPLDFWLRLIDGLLNQQFDAVLEEHGLTRQEWEILRLLGTGPATIDEFEADLLLFFPAGDKPTLAEGLAELVESGWVVSEGAEIELTDRGRTSLARLTTVVDRNRQSLTAGITPAEYAEALAVLEQMAYNLGWRETLEPATQDAAR